LLTAYTVKLIGKLWHEETKEVKNSFQVMAPFCLSSSIGEMFTDVVISKLPSCFAKTLPTSTSLARPVLSSDAPVASTAKRTSTMANGRLAKASLKLLSVT
jgi:hypothetical protein